MKKTNPVLIIVTQLIAAFMLLTVPGTFNYRAPVQSISAKVRYPFLSILSDIKSYDGCKGAWALNLQMVLVYILVICVIASIIICILTIANRIERKRIFTIIQCSPAAVLLLILIIGRLPFVQFPFLTSDYHPWFIEVKPKGLVVILLLLASVIIACLPDFSKDKTPRNINSGTTDKAEQITANESSDIKQTLLDLQEMYEQGLITEEEYNGKRKKYIEML